METGLERAGSETGAPTHYLLRGLGGQRPPPPRSGPRGKLFFRKLQRGAAAWKRTGKMPMPLQQGFQFLPGIELMGGQPGGIKQLGLVFVSRIAEQRHNGLAGSTFPGKAQRSGEVDAGGQPQKDPLLAKQLIDDGHGFLVGDAPGPVHGEARQVFGHAVLADAFGLGIAILGVQIAVGEPRPHGCTIRVGADHGDLGFCSCKNSAVPASVPPVPTAETNPVTEPPVCSQISGPVVR